MTSSPSSQPTPLTIDRWLMQQMVRSPIRDIDRYMVGLRWAGILLLAAPALLFWTQAPFVPPSQLILAGILVYNALLSLYSWGECPLANGRTLLPLLADVIQFIILTFAAHGHHSFYFIFALLAALEIALGYRWKVAVLGVLVLAGLQMEGRTLDRRLR